MYDQRTADLIRTARPIPGVDPARLPEQLTQAFAELVGHRMAMLSRGPQLDARVQILRQMANIYETHALVTNDADLRRSTAFVAASAHLLLAQAARAGIDLGTTVGLLEREYISPDLSAALLFVAAGYLPDAVEAIRSTPVNGTGRLNEVLVAAVVHLVRGELNAVLELRTPQSNIAQEDAQATDTLWFLLLDGVRMLAKRLLEVSQPNRPSDEDAASLFRRVLDLSVMTIEPLYAGGARIVSTFSGPHHLAALLLAAADSLGSRAVVDIPTPPTVDPDLWQDTLVAFAHRRPYLWPNHEQAIRGGYVSPGTSAVLSFPTGAGKSTLSELKIAATLCRGDKVIFLAPTLALVAQCKDALAEAFSNHDVKDSLVGEGFFATVDEPELPDIAVMTPERCLFLLGLYPNAFENVGLIVFDECHLLHPTQSAGDRRAVDAMLCLLGLLDSAPNADVVLLSAMVANAAELAAWLESATGRPCLSLDLEWKPTRQARGCVLFKDDDLRAMQNTLHDSRREGKTVAPSVRLVRGLKARPFGLFGLHQTWLSNAVEDYAVVPLFDGEVALGADKSWHLNANKNHVSAELARRLSELDIKTIVFTQDRRQAESISTALNQAPAAAPAQLNLLESHLLAQSVEEMGAAEHVIAPMGNVATCHHSLLLSSERALSESLFRRADGVDVIVSTPTLAQGMNLPAGAVIIAGDYRYDPESDDAAQLQAHELLNAAGRAGRAGYASLGIVMVVPSRLASFQNAPGSITLGQSWFDLREAVFAKVDHCLTIDDPLEHVLDRLHLADRPDGRIVRYFLNRLPLESADSQERTKRLLGRSLGAFRAARAGVAESFASKVAQAAVSRARLVMAGEEEDWCNRLASSTGVPALLLQNISNVVGPGIPAWTVPQFIDVVVGWLTSSGAILEYFLPAQNLEGVFHGAADNSGVVNVANVREKLLTACRMWTSGSTLRDLEIVIGKPGARLGSCVRARKFGRRLVVDISYAMGLFPQVIRERANARGEVEALPTSLAIGAACLRNGFDGPEVLALHMASRELLSRVGVHQLYRALGTLGIPADSEFRLMRHLADAAYQTWLMDRMNSGDDL